MIGLSIGLGNVWRFPYMMGQYGGSAFLFMYILFTIFFAIPAVMGEWALGRNTRSGPVGALSSAFGKKAGTILGIILLVTIVVADSYYLAVIANVTYSMFFSMVSGFSEANLNNYKIGLQTSWLQYLIGIILLLVSLWILYKGLNRGIERISKIFVISFAFIIIYLVIYSMSLEGSVGHLMDFLKPDFSAINSEVLFTALGQSYFSVGLGGTLLVIYGSYLNKEDDIPSGAALQSFGDLGAALLASLFIFPTLLIYGLNMGSGPGLLFETLPLLFSKMDLGRLIGSIFFIALTMVAFLSNLAALEVFTGGIFDFKKITITRSKALVILGVIMSILLIPSAFYPPTIAYLDLIFGSGMHTFGSGVTIVALTWGLGKAVTKSEIFGNRNGLLVELYFYWVKWVIPLALIVILISYIYSLF